MYKRQDEFLPEPATWTYSTGGSERVEDLPAGSLAFTLCGVPVLYRLGDSYRVHVFGEGDAPTVIEGNRLGPERSDSIFRRERRIRKLVVDLPEATLR